MTPIVGYRSWVVDVSDGSVIRPRSVTRSYIWRPGINFATCQNCEVCPGICDKENGCGFHAYHRLTDLQAMKMSGIVVGGGEVMVHCNAWRAEQSMCVAMIDNGWRAGNGLYNEQTFRKLADYFGVRVIPRSAAEMVAREYGEPVPEELIPPEVRKHNEERG